MKEFIELILRILIAVVLTAAEADAEPEVSELTAENLKVSTVSVSCLKVTWDSEENRDYAVSCTALDPDHAYTDNLYFVFKENGLCYITGIREGTEYTVNVKPVLTEAEKMISCGEPAEY